MGDHRTRSAASRLGRDRQHNGYALVAGPDPTPTPDRRPLRALRRVTDPAAPARWQVRNPTAAADAPHTHTRVPLSGQNLGDPAHGRAALCQGRLPAPPRLPAAFHRFNQLIGRQAPLSARPVASHNDPARPAFVVATAPAASDRPPQLRGTPRRARTATGHSRSGSSRPQSRARRRKPRTPVAVNNMRNPASTSTHTQVVMWGVPGVRVPRSPSLT